MAKKNIISSKNLSIGYPTKNNPVVITSGIDVSIFEGDFIAILGKNGIGKSTFLKTLTTELAPIEGNIQLMEADLNSYSSKQLASVISVVLTESIPMNQLTVQELIALGRQPYTNWIDNLSERDTEVVNKAMMDTETFDFKDKKIYELSDGMKQRVLIARALAQDTPVMILDEPTVHLDLYHTVQIFKLLKKLVEEQGKTIIISSHELNLSIKFASKLMVMNETTNHFGTTVELIAAKAFETLFPADGISFDSESQQFVIK
ncbi:MAG: ABC transporter ATP-binding protein [Flavobacteriaceae bacterium]|nr:ABC transporter ATP-binding protein [Flavobacteriaceae bacterium]|tara:strand:+ start:96708 stop:97490 length:783 start_codon:yes stop_codon:yes gene_type:complete